MYKNKRKDQKYDCLYDLLTIPIPILKNPEQSYVINFVNKPNCSFSIICLYDLDHDSNNIACVMSCAFFDFFPHLVEHVKINILSLSIVDKQTHTN